MAPSRSNRRHLAIFLLCLATASARPQGGRSTRTQSPSSTITSASSVTGAPNATTSGDIPLTLWSIANSLITHYYSSTTITNPATLTWPSTVVIDGSTYTMHTTPTGLTASPTKTDAHHTTATALPSSEAARTNHDNSKDQKIGIILGVVLGCVALALMGFLFWCLHRRKNDTGSFFMRRSSPSLISSSSGRSRAAVTFGPSSFAAVAGNRRDDWEEKQARMAVLPARKPPAGMHPALLRHETSHSTSSDNPFYTPDDVSSQELDSRQVQHAELDHHEPSTRRSSASIRDARPPTPFSPFEMSQMPGPSNLQQYRPQNHIQTSNPFSSPEDQEADDVISPILPSRSPERRYSPIIHYPSWSEVSEFDFAGDGRRRMSYDAGDDGWRAGNDRGVDGRHELA